MCSCDCWAWSRQEPLAWALGGREPAGRREGCVEGEDLGAGPPPTKEGSDHTALLLPRSSSTARLLPLPFVVAFLISSTGLWFCLRERAGRVFHGLCKPSACWCLTVTPGWVSQPCHVTCLIPQPAAMPGTQGKLLTIPLH